jgi:hypothetical protein
LTAHQSNRATLNSRAPKVEIAPPKSERFAGPEPSPREQQKDQARCIWSMWPGYLRELSGKRLRAWLERLGIQIVVQHASGHAYIADL